MKRIVIAVFMALTLTTFMFAQSQNPRFGRPPIGNPPGDGTTVQRGRAPNALAGLKAALNLTDGQVSAIQALMQTMRTRAEALMTDIRQKRQALDAQLDATTLNATDVGNAAIALRASEKKLPAERDWFIARLKEQLAGDQQQKLDTLLAANPRILGGGPGGPGGPRGLR